MKRILPVIFALVGVVFGLIFAFKKWDAKTAEAAREQSELRLKADYLERVAWIRVNPDEKSYKDEVGTFFRWWFKGVNDHINQLGGNRKFDDYLQELAEKSKKKGSEDEHADDKKAAYEYVRKFFDDFKEGKYDPMYTSTDHGIRWDILSTQPINGKTRLTFAVWGIPGEDREVDDRHTKKWVVSASYKSNWKLFDEKGKLFGEMPAEGVDMKVDAPHRYIKWFPREIIVGHFDVPLIPNEVKNAEITFTQTTRSLTGADIIANHTWKLDLPAEWKLKPGEKWEGAQDSVRPEEEINAQAKNDKTDKKAPKK
jgi:hypothetical protein